MAADPVVVLVGTLDTKGHELEYMRDRVREAGAEVVLVDVGVLGEPQVTADVSREEVAEAAGADHGALVAEADRGHAVEVMGREPAQCSAACSKGLMDGTFRAGLEETGMSYALEVDMIRHARELDLLTAPYVFTEDEVRKMADAGADVLVPHMGLTTGGSTVRRRASRSTRLSSASRRFVTQPCRSTPRSSASAIAGRSPSPTTPRRSSSARTAWSGSSARRAWSAFPPRWP